MSIIEAIIFGIVQGLTEFLPISSTAHIIILQWLFGIEFEGLTFEIVLHVASVLAVLLFFRHDVIAIIRGFIRFLVQKDTGERASFLFGLYLLVATAITGILGLILEDYAEYYLKSPLVIGGALLLTGIFLLVIERIHYRYTRAAEDMTMLDAFIIGLAQTLAVIPGVSRSGSTLITALAIGIDRKTAVRFSFLLAIPVIAGSSLLAVGDIVQGGFAEGNVVALILSFVVTFIFSIIGIKWLIQWLEKSKLYYFAIYCFVIGFVVIFFLDPTVV
ncbi:undecaprenyl-diphosphatase UppP [Natribacillus halophilus]|uniref:Undecaprenyl-diphosphatase n=1 Tax=Natribacillus halophilus TaxID=549003 RepID=A0A1G8JHT9_9BACI|nr:undecaprenyl-diphosphatase UppP [Natribacillus halophilus]SDI30623.1 Undecaprenyl-diphosphatase [Natribacillus halophilus]